MIMDNQHKEVIKALKAGVAQPQTVEERMAEQKQKQIADAYKMWSPKPASPEPDGWKDFNPFDYGWDVLNG